MAAALVFAAQVWAHFFVFMVLVVPMLTALSFVDSETHPVAREVAGLAALVLAGVGSWWLNSAFEIARLDRLPG